MHVEEVSESQSAHNQAKPPPGFTHSGPEGLDEDDWLTVWFTGAWSEEIGATQTISQKLVEASGGAPSKCFEDIVPQPYQGFRDVFAKESLNKLPNWKPWDHAIELVPDAHNFSTKVYPLAPVEQKQLDEFLDENLKSQCMCPSNSHPQSSSLKRKMGAYAWSKTTESSM